MYTIIDEILTELNDKAKFHPNDSFREAVKEVSDIIHRKVGGRSTSDNQKLLDQFIADKRLNGLSPGTIKNYSLELTGFLNSVQKPIKEISYGDIKDFITGYSILKKSTIATKISIIKSFFSYLTEEEIIERNPTRKIKKIKEEKRQPKYLSMVEILRLRESCGNDPRTRSMLEFLFETGCRVSEVTSLNKEDIDWEKRAIKIFGKGSKERTVYFHNHTYFFLKEYLATRTDENPALFVSKVFPNKRLHPRTIQMIIKELGIKAKLSKNIHPHALRHTYSTYLLNKGMDIAVVADLLGHEQLSTTQIYAKVTDNRKEVEYNKYFS